MGNLLVVKHNTVIILVIIHSNNHRSLREGELLLKYNIDSKMSRLIAVWHLQWEGRG